MWLILGSTVERTDSQTDGRKGSRMERRMDGRTDRRMEGRTNRRTEGRTEGRDGWKDGRSDGRTDRRTDGRTDGRTGEKIDGRTEGRTDGRRKARRTIFGWFLKGGAPESQDPRVGGERSASWGPPSQQTADRPTAATDSRLQSVGGGFFPNSRSHVPPQGGPADCLDALGRSADVCRCLRIFDPGTRGK